MKINVNAAMGNHLGNISRQIGRDVTNRYSYITTSDELTNAFLQAKSDLGYPLRKEVKRDRFVLNAESLEKALEEAINKTFNEVEKGLTELANDTINDIVSSLNGLTVTNDHFVAKPPKRSFAADLGKMLGKTIAKSTVKIFDDMINGNNRRR